MAPGRAAIWRIESGLSDDSVYPGVRASFWWQAGSIRSLVVSSARRWLARSCDISRRTRVPAASVGEPDGVTTFAATAALPYEHLERAAAALRAELSRQLLAADVHDLPEWDTLHVSGPNEFTDLRGRTWYEYRATVEGRRPFDRAPTVTPPGRLPTRPT